jgi:hypothetical protein
MGADVFGAGLVSLSSAKGLSEPVSEKISEEEAFANGFFYFVKALKTLAADADTQCKRMGNYNVAWELKDDVSAGGYLLNLPGAPLTQEEKDGIVAMVAALNNLPASLLVAATTEAANKKAMSDPSWEPLRARASELLKVLAVATARTEAFLAGLNS